MKVMNEGDDGVMIQTRACRSNYALAGCGGGGTARVVLVKVMMVRV